MSKRQVAISLAVSATAARDCIFRARCAGLAWPLPQGLTDETLGIGSIRRERSLAKDRPRPDWAMVHRELRRPGVTLQLLWEEHRCAAHPDGYGYSRFCELYRTWEGRLSPTMRQSHIAGERMFIDYAGTTLAVIDGLSGEARTAQLFVAVLGASNYTYAEATWAQACQTGSARIRTPLRSSVASRRWWCPTICARASPRPASTSRRSTAPTLRWRPTTTPPLCRRGRIGRGTKPRSKLRCKWATRFIIAKLRNQQFFSLSALNAAIAELVAQINDRVSRHLGASRHALFEEIERSALKPLPAEPYVFTE